MRKGYLLFTALLLILSLSLGVSAVTGASGVSSFATVSADGACQVTMTVTLHMEQAVSELRFPIPLGASDVTVNGSRVWTSRADSARQVDLSKLVSGVVGDVTVSIHYALSDLIHKTDAGLLELRLPILAGFAYPISAMNFSVTLPGAVESTPTFSSGYHQAEIEKIMELTVEGATVSGTFLEELKDHETLSLSMPVSETMFPQTVVEIRNMDFVYTAMGICGGLALVYWLLFLRTLPFLRQYCPEPPEGVTAGQIGCILHTQGLDLTMTVFSWARLGYILIQLDRHDRVLLHKRMDMGNERSEAERVLFKKLFGKKNVVDTSGIHYALLRQSTAKRPMGLQELMRPQSGNARIFRALASGVGAFGGLALGNALGGDAALADLVMVLLAAAGGIGAWLIQEWAYSLLLRERQKLLLALGCCGGWLLLGIIGNSFLLCLCIVLGMLFAGLLTAFGGRRTHWGRQVCGQLLGLRHYLRTVPREELQRICRSNPDYFYTMLPCAVALGSGKRFAKGFGAVKLPGCSWLTTGMDAHMTAGEWEKLLRLTAELMDARFRQLPIEKILGFLGNLRK